MTDKQAVIDALERLPEGASLEEITEELAHHGGYSARALGYCSGALEEP